MYQKFISGKGFPNEFIEKTLLDSLRKVSSQLSALNDPNFTKHMEPFNKQRSACLLFLLSEKLIAETYTWERTSPLASIRLLRKHIISLMFAELAEKKAKFMWILI